MRENPPITNEPADGSIIRSGVSPGLPKEVPRCVADLERNVADDLRGIEPQSGRRPGHSPGTTSTQRQSMQNSAQAAELRHCHTMALTSPVRAAKPRRLRLERQERQAAPAYRWCPPDTTYSASYEGYAGHDASIAAHTRRSPRASRQQRTLRPGARHGQLCAGLPWLPDPACFEGHAPLTSCSGGPSMSWMRTGVSVGDPLSDVLAGHSVRIRAPRALSPVRSSWKPSFAHNPGGKKARSSGFITGTRPRVSMSFTDSFNRYRAIP